MQKGSRDGETPTKTCPECDEIVLLAATECPSCGHQLPRNTMPKHASYADRVAILSPRRIVSDWLEVEDIEYRFHHKETPSLRVTFQCEVQSFSKWVCLQHTGYARTLAEQFWRVLSGGTPVPRTVDEALERQDELGWVTHIRVTPEGDRYWRIIGYRIAGENYDGNLHRAIAWGRPEINDNILY